MKVGRRPTSAKSVKVKPTSARRRLAPSGEALERLLAEVVFDAVWEWNVGSDTIRWGGNLESIFGYPRDEVSGHVDWWRARVHPDDVERAEQAGNKAIRGKAAGFSTEYRFRRKDGSWASVATRAVIVRDAQRHARRVVGAMIDVSTLKETEARLRLFTEQIPARATGTDRDLRVVWDVGAAYPSNPSSVGKTVPELFAQSPDRERVLEGCRNALKGESTALEIDDGTAAASLQLVPFRDASGRVIGVIGIAFDITERVRAERALRNTERLLVDAEKLGQTGSWEQDLITGQIVNSTASRRLFFGDDPNKGAQIEDYAAAIHPDDRERVMRGREAMLAGTGPADIEYRVVWPDGSVRLIFARATVVRDESGRAIRVYGTNADVTERRRAEEELARRARQLESLSRKLIQAQEDERRALANELHDDLGQMLFALKLNLERSGRGDGGNDGAENIALVDGAIARMRNLVQALRPPLLDEVGLEASLRWHVEREATRAGLTFHMTLAPLEKRPQVTVEITCFRIAQEALSNVIRHAQAKTVEIELGESGGALQLVVRDDGHGFDVAAGRQRATIGASQGLLSMQERVALVGGELQIDSAPGRGTTVRARLPLKTQGRR
jgi:two-component system sensor histidine kinase UhpB